MAQEFSIGVKGLASYYKMLLASIEVLNPKLVLEWGPGYSTKMLLANTEPECTICTWENDPKWYAKYYEEFKEEPRVKLYLEKIVDEPRILSSYVLRPARILGEGQVDLVFVDGAAKYRGDCFYAAHFLVRKNGAVILHDYSNAVYGRNKRIFQYYFEEPELDTGVYSKDPVIIEQIKNAYAKQPIRMPAMWPEIKARGSNL